RAIAELEAPLASSKRPPERGTLRTLFRRLAEAIHPDKVQDEHERLRRTEVMKQVTVAYQDGDYARLIEIERTWVARVDDDGGVPDEPDEVERRLAARERAIAELEAQLAELEREIRAVRASEDGKLAREARRADEVGGVTEVESEAAADVERMRAVRDFIVEFRDGGMTFERFRDGPGGSERSDPFGEPYDDGGDSPFGGVPPGFPPGFDPFAGFPPGFDPFAPSRAGRPGSGRSPRAGAGLDPSTGSPFDALDGAFERAAPPEVVRLLADLERLARAEGVHPRDLLRAIRAAAYGAGPRRRR
ncbi:MAG TPA: hypothetical protein VHE35_11370, partial [Kofleriaceae bacterium]|nr:hypothetical protein [Kofleriaceae bacterium]